MAERLSVQVDQDDFIFETGRIAKQADGAVMVTCGETMVLSAVCAADEARPGQGFFPLTVDYREKSFAAGRIPGNFFRREGRPTEREILVDRLTDRPLRPLFPKGFLNEVQVCQTVFSTDNEHDPDVLSINAASAALHISRVPFDGPIGAVRVGLIEGEFVANTLMGMRDRSEMDLILAGTKEAIIMVEGEANEIDEDTMVKALEFGHAHIKTIIEGIEELRSRVGIEKMAFEPPQPDPEIVNDIESMVASRMSESLNISDKQERQSALDALKTEAREKLCEKYGEELYEERAEAIKEILRDTEKRLMRDQVIKTSKRIDGRALDEIRRIDIEVGLLPRAHGSCLFTRGETQAIVTTTLGTSRDEQRIDELTGDEFKRFMLHYNFPAWSVGEVRRIMGPGRREIGHGNLARRALETALPFDEEDAEANFPYTIRIVSDITESNGSSSMATVCGGTMAMMDAGVPLEKPVAGIAMGMIKEGDEVRILTDILGVEDHLGDMDFKVCGTRKGITAFQMDIKASGISSEIMSKALYQARDGRLFILDKMHECLAEPREDISKYAPRIFTITIDPDKIRDVIGPGGKVIREIQSVTGAEIEIEDDGTVNVAATDKDSADAAIEMIKHITAEIEIGKIYHGKVVRLMNFGAFVSVLPSKDGLVHISELAPGRVESVEDVVNIGDEIDVKVIEVDNMGRVNLSKVQADRELGRLTPEEEAEMEKNSSRGKDSRRDGDSRKSGGGRRGGGGGGSRGSRRRD